jgi:endonuclease/exonuclease/phosphatase family metal-dependent hydrolase
MVEQLSLITVNIEAHKHLDLVIPFLQKENPDVICLQEVFKEDIPAFEHSLQRPAFFVPMSRILKTNRYGLAPMGEWGVAILTALPIVEKNTLKYFQYKENELTPEFLDGTPNSQDRICLVVKVNKNGEEFTVITTHFTWTGDGHANDEQRRDLKEMLSQLSAYDEFVLCGDFNAPRGRETFDALAHKYIDHIPTDVTTTIDGSLHYAGNLQIVVDGMFSTPHYEFDSVEVLSGVSDHRPVKAVFHKKK